MWFKYHNCIPEYPCEHATATIISNPAQLPARLYLSYNNQLIHGKSGSTGILNSSSKERFSLCKMNQTDVAGSLEHVHLVDTHRSALPCLHLLQGQLSFLVILLFPQSLQHSFQMMINYIAASIFVFLLQNEGIKSSGFTSWWLCREMDCMT